VPQDTEVTKDTKDIKIHDRIIQRTKSMIFLARLILGQIYNGTASGTFFIFTIKLLLFF